MNPFELSDAEIDAARRSLHYVQGANGRWGSLIDAGATDDQILQALSREYGLGGGSTGPDQIHEWHVGGANPRLEIGDRWDHKIPVKLFKTRRLVSLVRVLLSIPIPGQDELPLDLT